MESADPREWLRKAADAAARLAAERAAGADVRQDVMLPDDELDLRHDDEDRDQLVEGGKAG